MNDRFSQDEYETFINSLFFKKGEIVFRDGNPILRNNKVSFFDTGAYTIDEAMLIRSVVNRGEDFSIVELQTDTSLYYSLKESVLPVSIKKKIITQWSETLRVINQIKINPVSSMFIVGLEGSYIRKHNHDGPVKQTLTFQFDYPEFTDSSWQDYVSLYNNNNEISHRLQTGKTNKTVFTMRDNVRHDASIKNLRFYWFYDFEEYIDLSKIDFGDFEFIEFESVQG